MATRLLVVDDDPNILETLKDVLEDAGHTVVVAASVKAALALPYKPPFDLAILDLNLADGSGIDLAERLKAKQPKIRVLLISGQAIGDEPFGLSARRKGIIDSFLVKPVNPAELLGTIREILS